MTETMPHILVVDDDTRLRNLLNKYLTDNGFMVTAAEDAEDALRKLKSFEVDLVVLDVMMPGKSGFEMTTELRGTSSVPILLLTAMSENENRIEGLERGADDYLTKPFEPRELVLRINSILRRVGLPDNGVPVEDGDLVRLGRFRFDTERAMLFEGDSTVHLTSTESGLLQILARQPGVTLSREALCEAADLDAASRAIDVQVTRLRRKFEDDPRMPRYLHTVRGQGYVLKPDRP
jgi:two-component system phosphate regulon response regulator OmpR